MTDDLINGVCQSNMTNFDTVNSIDIPNSSMFRDGSNDSTRFQNELNRYEYLQSKPKSYHPNQSCRHVLHVELDSVATKALHLTILEKVSSNDTSPPSKIFHKWHQLEHLSKLNNFQKCDKKIYLTPESFVEHLYRETKDFYP